MAVSNRNIRKDIQTKSLGLNYLLNTSRTVLNFLIPLIIFPYASRVLGPEGLGKVEFANSIVSYFILFTALGIPTYGMREIARIRDDEHLRSKTVQELALILTITVLFGYIIFFLLIRFIPHFYEQRILFFIVAPTIFLSDFSFEWFYQGIENQTYITIRYIITKVIQTICIFLFIKQENHFYRYAAILVGMNSIATIFNLIHLRNFIRFVPIRETRPFRHFKQIVIIFASIVAVNIYMHLDVTMVGFIVGEEYVGLYTAANRLVRIIISLATALSAVIIPRLENCLKKGDEESYKKYLNISLHYILMIAIPCFLGVQALANDIILIFAGTKYLSSIKTIRILSPIIFIVPLAYFTGLQILYPRRMEWKYTLAVSIAAVINALCNALLIRYFEQNGAAIGTLIAEGLGLLIQFIFARHYIRDTDLFSLNTAKYFIAGIIMFLSIIFIPSGKNLVLHCFSCIAIAILIYFVSLLAMQEETITNIMKRGRK